MFTNEWLAENAERINAVLDHADEMGTGGASLGTLALVSLSDDEWTSYQNATTDEELQALFDVVIDRFAKAGVKVE
jgi:hypothetical protein